MLIEAANEDLRRMLVFAASTGARAGEQWAARWRDVDFDRVEFQIARRVDVYGDEGAPKSSAGVRGVPLSGQLVAMLKAWKIKSKFSKQDDLIFPNRDGGYVCHDNLVKRQFLPLFEGCRGLRGLSIGTVFATLQFRAGLKPGLTRKQFRLSRAMRRCRSRWTAMGTYSRVTATSRRWIRLLRDCSNNQRPTGKGQRNVWRNETLPFHVPSV